MLAAKYQSYRRSGSGEEIILNGSNHIKDCGHLLALWPPARQCQLLSLLFVYGLIVFVFVVAVVRSCFSW